MLSVCNFHYIRETFDSKYQSIFGITPNSFEKQLRALKNNGDFITPKEFIKSYHEILSSKDNLYLISFDDGLKEQIQLAFPILESLNLEAVFFANSINTELQKVSTVHKIHLLRSLISSEDLLKKINVSEQFKLSKIEFERAVATYRFDNKESAFLKYLLNFKLSYKEQETIISSLFMNYFDENEVLDQLYMNKKDLIFLANKNCLGSHTHSHYPIGLLKKDEIKFELQNSKTYFERVTCSPIHLVSYPYGTPETSTDKVAEIAKEIGYKFGFTTTKGSNDEHNNHLLLNRFDCNDLIGGKNYIV